MMDGLNFSVGERFPIPIAAVGDGGMFQADANGSQFILQLSRADVIAVEAFRTGKMELALYEQAGVLFFLYQIDGIFKDGWGDAPLGLHLLKREQWPTEKSLADPTLHLYLVDTNLQILLAMRQVAMSNEFHQVLTGNIKEQMKCPVDSKAYAQTVRQVWAQWKPEEMRERASAVQEVPLEISSGKMLH